MKTRFFPAVVLFVLVVLFSAGTVAFAQSFNPQHEEIVSSNNTLAIETAEQGSVNNQQEDSSQTSSRNSEDTNKSDSQEAQEMPSTAQSIEGVGGIDLSKVSDKPEKEVMHSGS